jgi:Fe-S-cluster-containing hydrogenase component 2
MSDYEKTGVLSLEDLNLPSEEFLERGVAVVECVEDIPCDPCVDSCPVDAISMENLVAPPVIDFERCTGCGGCVGVCPGLAIFVVKTKGDKAFITLPYEFLPTPRVGDVVEVLDREGRRRGKGVIKKVVRRGKTMVVTVEVSRRLAMEVRNIRV